VQVERPQDALYVLKELPEVRDAALFGAGLHVVAAEEQQAATAIRDALKREGYAIEALERITPGLEDVFVALIEELSGEDNNG
jgi:ABC-2 type transport system ATP-binding protein